VKRLLNLLGQINIRSSIIRIILFYLFVIVVEEIIYNLIFNNSIPKEWNYFRGILLIPIWFISYLLGIFFMPIRIGGGIAIFYMLLIVATVFSIVGIRKGRRSQDDELLNMSITILILAIIGFILYGVLYILLVFVAAHWW
jgi:predicted AlkP superfamily pyrophosphatase or phosphodiesterase